MEMIIWKTISLFESIGKYESIKEGVGVDEKKLTMDPWTLQIAGRQEAIAQALRNCYQGISNKTKRAWHPVG